jgi:hypothetical protein
VQRLSPVFNVLAIIAAAFGVATSLGMGATQINSDLPINTFSQAGIIIITTLLFLVSAVSGVGRGIKWRSTGNRILAATLAMAVLIVGPTIAIFNTFTTTLGAYISDVCQHESAHDLVPDRLLDWQLDDFLLGLVAFLVTFCRPVHRTRLTGTHYSPVHRRHGDGADLGRICLVLDL